MQLIQSDKHRIPFYSDVKVGLMTLHMLKTQAGAFKHIVAGHGEIYTSSEQTMSAIEYMMQHLESILANVRAALADDARRTTADIVSEVARAQGITISDNSVTS